MEAKFINSLLETDVNPDSDSFISILFFADDEHYESSTVELTVHGVLGGDEIIALNTLVQELLEVKEQAGANTSKAWAAVIVGSTKIDNAVFIADALERALKAQVGNYLFTLATDRMNWQNLTMKTSGIL